MSAESFTACGRFCPKMMADRRPGVGVEPVFGRRGDGDSLAGALHHEQARSAGVDRMSASGCSIGRTRPPHPRAGRAARRGGIQHLRSRRAESTPRRQRRRGGRSAALGDARHQGRMPWIRWRPPRRCSSRPPRADSICSPSRNPSGQRWPNARMCLRTTASGTAHTASVRPCTALT